MARFIAVPVSKGDAFYFEDGSFSVLVDGGMYACEFSGCFKHHVERKRVSTLVCTHNDADHANGLIGYLGQGLGCDEVWLPARWLGALPDVLRPFVEIYDDLARDISRATSESPDLILPQESSASPLERYAAGLSEQNGEEEESQGTPLTNDGWPEECIEVLERADVGIPPFGAPDRYPAPDDFFWLIKRKTVSSQYADLLWSALAAAERIRTIATLAFHRGIPVRWFEFDPAKPAGGRGEFKPVNARQIATVRPRRASLLLRLALTESNRESLVFHALANQNHPGVLFTADSDLNGAAVPKQLEGAIITAPHHGSESNAPAYAAIKAAISTEHYKSLRWVRSDGRYKSRPGRTYLGLPAARTCTICRKRADHFSTKQAVRFIARSRQWVHYPGVRSCQCVTI